jgi:biopolymer transport protein ExbD
MNPTMHRILLAFFAIGLCSGMLAADQSNFAQVSLVGAGGGKPVSREELVILVVEGPVLFSDSKPIPDAQVVEFVNGLLRAHKVSYIGVYAREGTKYGEVIHAVDTLRRTEAKNIGVSMSELPFGREP